MKKVLIIMFIVGVFFSSLTVRSYAFDVSFPSLYYFADGELLFTGFDDDLDFYFVVNYYDMYYEEYNLEIDDYHLEFQIPFTIEDLRDFVGYGEDMDFLDVYELIGFFNMNNFISLIRGTPSPDDIYITGFSVQGVNRSFSGVGVPDNFARVYDRNLFKNMISSYIYDDIPNALQFEYDRGVLYGRSIGEVNDDVLLGFVPSVVGSMLSFIIGVFNFSILGFSIGTIFFLSSLIFVLIWLMKAVK